MTDKHVNLKFLEENTQGDPALMAELIEIFLNTTPPMLLEIEEFYRLHDWSSLRKVAHKLKSNLNTLGIDELSAPIMKVERFTGEGSHIEEIGALIEKIRRISQLASKELMLELELLKKQ